MWTKPWKDMHKGLNGGTPMFRENQSLMETQCMITVLPVGNGKNTNYLPLPLLNCFFLSCDENVVTLQRAFLAHLLYALA
jgi:hypothetical protein